MQYVVGDIHGYAGKPPAGFLPCRGQELSKTYYRKLYEVIGSCWNNGKESSANVFRLPNVNGPWYIYTGVIN